MLKFVNKNTGRITWRKKEIKVYKRQAMYVRRNTEAFARNICCREKLVKYYISWECICILALVIRHASCIFPESYYLPSVACPALKHLSTYLINGTIFGKSYINMRAFIFSTLIFWHIFHSKKNTARCYYQCTLVFMQSIHDYCHI